MKQENIVIANKTARATGSVGKNAIVPKYVRTIAKAEDCILDFGSGPKAIHTASLRSEGFNVTAYDFGINVNDLHDVDALGKKYDIVFASNVLNTLTEANDIYETIEQIAKCVKEDGIMVVNVPATPRKLKDNPQDTHKIVWGKLHELYCRIDRVGGTASAPIYKATNKLPQI